MKRLGLIMVFIFAMTLLVGCLPSWPGGPGEPVDPVVPILTMEANVDAVLVDVEEGESTQVAWSIENVGDLFIREYVITFDVLYPMETKDNVIFKVVGNYLEIGAKHEGILDLVAYDTPETVSVSWELFE